MLAPVIVWFRQDLRLADNPALRAAMETGRPIVPLYVLDDDHGGDWRMGAASRWWLHHSLAALGEALKGRGSHLILRRGKSEQVLVELANEIGAEAVFWNRCYDPAGMARDEAVEARLHKGGVDVQTSNAFLLFEPWTVQTRSQTPFKVFSPYWKACQDQGVVDDLAPTPRGIAAPPSHLQTDRLTDWDLRPTKPNWAKSFEPEWTPGEDGAQEALSDFVDEALVSYSADRDRPALTGSSRLSPHLHFGEIGPRQVWRAIREAAKGKRSLVSQADKYLSELGWREFSYHLLHQAPAMPDESYRPEYETMPWKRDKAGFEAWTRGLTGVPIVDAGMRQLWQTGWMHNRVRMITASFLVKHLLVRWQEGARWFWDTLVDADLANNTVNWQWVAGCGADAAPFFRVFNPVLQGQKFDSEGDYIRRYVPELAKLPTDAIHMPWTVSKEVLAKADVRLGETYPEPIVDLDVGRKRALAAFATLKKAA